jgi:hypothetical protein
MKRGAVVGVSLRVAPLRAGVPAGGKKKAAPKPRAASGSDYPLGSFGGGAVADRGKRK